MRRTRFSSQNVHDGENDAEKEGRNQKSLLPYLVGELCLALNKRHLRFPTSPLHKSGKCLSEKHNWSHKTLVVSLKRPLIEGLKRTCKTRFLVHRRAAAAARSSRISKHSRSAPPERRPSKYVPCDGIHTASAARPAAAQCACCREE